jgi:hypothetical protein
MTGETHADLAPDEMLLQGALSGEITGTPDAGESRIRWLVAHRLHAVASSPDGWEWLFRDPRDGRLWEQSFPLGSLHGSGPRRLAVITPAAAHAKYGVR